MATHTLIATLNSDRSISINYPDLVVDVNDSVSIQVQLGNGVPQNGTMCYCVLVFNQRNNETSNGWSNPFLRENPIQRIACQLGQASGIGNAHSSARGLSDTYCLNISYNNKWYILDPTISVNP